jgi:hypothetical protein
VLSDLGDNCAIVEAAISNNSMLNLIRSFISHAFKALGIRETSPAPQSIFELIVSQVGQDPNWQIDESQFPKIRVSDESELSFAAGAMDAVLRGLRSQIKTARPLKTSFQALTTA